MSQVGIVGLGNLGMGIASKLHYAGVEVKSLTKNPREVPWKNTTDLSEFLRNSKYFSKVILAAGVSKPAFCDFSTDLELSLGIANKVALSSDNTRFFLLSTGAVYGECLQPMREIDPVSPTSQYGLVKNRIEILLQKALPERVTILRIGNVFGPEQSFGIAKTLRDSYRKKIAFNLSSPLDTTRDYMSERYFQESLYSILKQNQFHTVINLGSGKSLTIKDVMVILQNSLGGELEINIQKVNHSDLLSTKLDTSKLKSIHNLVEDPAVSMKMYFTETLQA